jgi:hypothetical protein
MSDLGEGCDAVSAGLPSHVCNEPVLELARRQIIPTNRFSLHLPFSTA